MRPVALLVLCLLTACVWYEGFPAETPLGDSSSTSAAESTSEPMRESTSSSTSTSGVDESSADDNGSFIMEPDDGPSPYACDLWENDCPRGEKCMPYGKDGGHAWDATKCTPIARDPQDPGEPCTVVDSAFSGIDDCGASSMCWDVDPETNMGECIAFCTGSEANPVCEEPGTHCTIAGDSILILCLPECDPLLQDCDEGEGCYPLGEWFDCGPDTSRDAGEYGDPCEFVNVCDPGLFCANADAVPLCASAVGCCSAFCDLGGPMCPPSTECVPWYEAGQAPPEYETVGACVAEGA